VNDRLLLRIGEKATEPTTVTDGGDSFTFTGHGYIRIGSKHVIVEGGVTAFTLKAAADAKVTVNGKRVEAAHHGDRLSWRSSD